MSSVPLTCAETPLAWPTTVELRDIPVCTTCAVQVSAPHSGSLQILTRRQGGVGDGVNIEEATDVAADYRGQRYTFEEAIFHVPGLHVFPRTEVVFPAEYHIHMTTFAEPRRKLTLVLPVSHRVEGPGQDYFAAMARQPDPSAQRPALTSLFVPGTPILTYRGPEIRGRTIDVPAPDANCGADDEHQYLLVQRVCQIRAADLERIPREGSLSTDPRDLPAPGVQPTTRVPRDRLLKTVVLAQPGIAGPVSAEPVPKPADTELECRPLKVVDGRDVIDMEGRQINLRKLLGDKDSGFGAEAPTTPQQQTDQLTAWLTAISYFVGTMIGLFLADWLLSRVWGFFFVTRDNSLFYQWEPLKVWIFLSIAVGAAFGGESLSQWLGL